MNYIQWNDNLVSNAPNGVCLWVFLLSECVNNKQSILILLRRAYIWEWYYLFDSVEWKITEIQVLLMVIVVGHMFWRYDDVGRKCLGKIVSKFIRKSQVNVWNHNEIMRETKGSNLNIWFRYNFSEIRWSIYFPWVMADVNFHCCPMGYLPTQK